MKRRTIYPVINDGTVVKTFTDYEAAESYACGMNDRGARDSAKEYDYDVGSWKSYYQNGNDGGLYEVGSYEIPLNRRDDEKFTAKNGDNILVDCDKNYYDIPLEEIRASLR